MTSKGTGVRKRSPARYVAMSAGHELFASPKAALEETVRDRLQRRIEILTQHELGRSWRPYAVESTRLNRSIDGGIDDIKFLYPLVDNIPVIVLPLLNFARAGIPLSLYATEETCRVAEVVRAYLLEIGWIDDLAALIVTREDRSSPGFFQAFKGSTDPLRAAAEDVIVWSAGDLVLAYDVWPWLLEPDIEEHELVVNLIARDRIFEAGTEEFVRLEYFDSLSPRAGAAAREVRQPDMLVMTGRGLGGLVALEAIRGRPEAELFGILFKRTWRGLLGGKAGSMLRAVSYGIRRKRYSIRPGRGIAQGDACDFASLLFGVPTMVKGESGDPFIVKDADGFEEVFGYYRTMLQGVVDSAGSKEAGYKKLERYYPHAEHLYRLSARLAPLWNEIPLWRGWTEFIRDKTATYNARLKTAFEDAGVPVSGPPVTDYFAADGRFVFHPPPRHSDVAGSLAFLAHAYRDRYERGLREWAAVASPGVAC